MEEQVNNIINEIINNKDNLSFDSIINKYSSGDINIIKAVEKELSNNYYEIISIDPIKVKKNKTT